MMHKKGGLTQMTEAERGRGLENHFGRFSATNAQKSAHFAGKQLMLGQAN